MDARSSITNQLSLLAQCGDLGDPVGAASVYTPDGAFSVSGFPSDVAEDGEVRGRDALTAMYAGLFEANKGQVRHWVGTTHFVESDRVGIQPVRSYFFLLRVGIVPAPGIVLTGTYDDEFVLDDGQWLLRRRSCRIDPRPDHRDRTPSDALLAAFDERTRTATGRIVNEHQ